MFDAQRKGDTVKPFTEPQSWDLLMKLLGPEWQERDKNGQMRSADHRAAKDLLKSLDGVSTARTFGNFVLVLTIVARFGNPASRRTHQKPRNWRHNNCNYICVVHQPQKRTATTSVWGALRHREISGHSLEYDIQLPNKRRP